jgi:cyclohexanecarboxylate-CoA ligase
MARLPAIEPESVTGWWDLVVRRAELTPNLPLVADTRGRQLTAGAYARTAETVAAALWDRGVRPGMTVSWQLPSSLEAAVLVSALARLDVRQNPIMPVLRAADLAPIMGQLRPDFLLTPRTFRGFDHATLGRELVAEYGGVHLVVPVAEGDPQIALPEGDPAVLADVPLPNAPASAVRWVFYTSGTTGTPKGAMHTDASVIASGESPVRDQGLTEDDVQPVPFPVAHIGGPLLLSAGLRTGARTVFVEIFDPATSPFELGAAGVTSLGSAVPFFDAYLAAQRRHGSTPLFPRLRYCVSGGAPTPPDLHGRVARELGGIGILNGYGLTECPMVIATPLDAPPDDIAAGRGRSLDQVVVRIASPDDQELPAGQEGELRLRAPQLFVGYVDPGLDQHAFDSDGFFKTGDLAIVDADGAIRITGRLKDIIIRNAENISALELENALSGHPDIVDVGVFGIPDRRTGERCCAAVVMRPGAAPLDLDGLREFCAGEAIARYKVPELILVVDAIPRNSMGKISKAELRDQAISGPDRSDPVAL